MRGHDNIASDVEPEPRWCLLRLDLLLHRNQRVDHRVSDLVDVFVRGTLANEVRDRLGRVDEEKLRERVRKDPVDLLWHRPVEASKPGLDVADRNAELCRDKRCGKGRVHVPGDEQDVRPGLDEEGLEALHHPSGLLCVRSGADVEHVGGTSFGELIEKDGRRVVLVVLLGVNEDRRESIRASVELGDHGRRLHEVGPGADHRDHSQGGCHGRRS